MFHFIGQRMSDITGEDETAGLETRPRIGFALGGGAARGWAHIGVIQTLSEAGIRPDVIAGTSMGAVVGGCYAVGRLDDLADFARSLTRRRLFGLLDLNFGGSSLVGGNRLFTLLDRELGGMKIEDLPLEFAAIATELKTGHEIWLRRGRLVEAMRASYALPGIFAPYRISGRWLIDGALVNPVPVSTARALGARLVVAVNLSADTFGRGTVVAADLGQGADAEAQTSSAEMETNGANRLLKRQLLGRGEGAPGISSVMLDAFNIIQDRIARSRLAGDPPDVTIGPRMAHIGLFEFHRAADAIALGREAAERALPQIVEMTTALS